MVVAAGGADCAQPCRALLRSRESKVAPASGPGSKKMLALLILDASSRLPRQPGLKTKALADAL